MTDCISFVHGLIHVANCNTGDEFLGGKAVFSDELPVNARDISTRVYQYRGVDDFEGVQEGDQLNRDMHRFIQS